MTRDQEKARQTARAHKSARLAFEREIFGSDAPRMVPDRSFKRQLVRLFDVSARRPVARA
jgi:hypothetical protein